MQKTIRYVKPGETVRMEIGFSECACYIGAAGKIMNVQLLDRKYPMAQLYSDDGRPYSAPITVGEAGIYREDDRFYYYPVDCQEVK